PERAAEGWQKVKLAHRLRAETTMSLAWIAGRLHMGWGSHVSSVLRKSKSAKSEDRHRHEEFCHAPAPSRPWTLGIQLLIGIFWGQWASHSWQAMHALACADCGTKIWYLKRAPGMSS